MLMPTLLMMLRRLVLQYRLLPRSVSKEHPRPFMLDSRISLLTHSVYPLLMAMRQSQYWKIWV